MLTFKARFGADARTISRLQGYLTSRRHSYSAGEIGEIRELVRPMVLQAAFNQYLSQYLGIPFLDWEDVDPFHRRLAIGGFAHDARQRVTQKHLQATRTMFGTTLNALVPRDRKHLIRFLKADASVASLRAAVAERLVTGGALDERWAEEVRHRALAAQLARQRLQRKITWIAALINLVVPGASLAVPGVDAALDAGGAAADLGQEGFELALEEGGNRRIAQRVRRFEWYYTLTGLRDEA